MANGIQSALRLIALMLAAASVLAVSFAAPAAETTTNPELTIQTLYEHCKASDIREHALCAGFISGVLETMRLVGGYPSQSQLNETQKAFGICLNNLVTFGAATQVFKNWAEKHPEQWSQMRLLGVVKAFRETWPCT